MLLQQFAGIESDLPIRMFGLRHAISAPAWEALDFEVPDADWVSKPDWSMIPGADELNQRYTDLPVGGAATAVRRSPVAMARSFVQRTLEPLHGKPWARPIFDLSYGFVIARRSPIVAPAGTIDITYGADSQTAVRIPKNADRFVCLEHGTLRFLADGTRELAAFRRAYRDQIQRAGHVWVTNLDPRTLEIAEDLVPGRWSATPHPYVPDPRVPFAESTAVRQELLTRTASDSIILLPSSQNWVKHHDKGSMKALKAFVKLRRAGRQVGLVAIEWGLQLAESKEFLEKAGVAGNVAWVPPMARVALQRTMANVDVVWDQFGLEAFGGLAIRTMEQGAPMISRGLSEAGERLIGGPVPWRHAATTVDLARETGELLDEIAEHGRDAVMAEHRTRNRRWFLETHSPMIAAELQREVYAGLLDGTWERGAAAPDRWATLVHDRKVGRVSDR
jgi:hypothetical protein